MIYYTNDKTPIHLEQKPFASGGEGEVFKIISPKTNISNQCAKIYFSSQRTKEREEKIKFMVQNIFLQHQNSLFCLCFPINILFDIKGNFAGFTMLTAFSGSIQLYELVTTQINKKLSLDWTQKYNRATKIGIENRLKLCVNIAIAIHTIHKTKNFTLVDFKPQNILIAIDGRVSIIDLDSIQISNGKKLIHPAKVATPEYTPKEGDNLNPAVDFIDDTWDRFSLAIVFYEILFGIHPYTATSIGQYSDATTISEKISKNLFVHGSKTNYLSIIPSIHKNFNSLPISLKSLFLASFENGSKVPSARPTAETWGQVISEELQKANVRPNTFSASSTVPKSIPYNDSKVKQITPLPTPQIKPNITSQNNSNDDFIGKFILFVLIIGTFLIVYFASFNSSKNYSQSTENTSTIDTDIGVDTTVAVDTVQAYDDNTMAVDTVVPENSTNDIVVDATPDNNVIALDEDYSALDASNFFLSSLDNRKYEDAWSITYNPKWERKGKDWFCSIQAYGGINNIELYEITQVSNYGDEAVIFAKYYAEDIYNGNGTYYQNFILKKYDKKWLITDIRNIRVEK